MTHPYQNADARQFWNRTVAGKEAHLFNPVFRTKFKIDPSEKVATAGSCFAQHIANGLRRHGCNFLICEAGEHLPEAERIRCNYGLFTARYGNIYTPTQMNQLMDEAYGWRSPHEWGWQRPDGRWIDPARQQVEPDGFDSPETLRADRTRHLQAVSTMFTEADVFIFTLGLTEAWRSKTDGSIYSSAPGVLGGAFDPDLHEFVNFDVAATHTQLRSFLVKLRAVNPRIKVLLTVSPVPLAATYEAASVVCASTYSKSVLRVVAQMAISEFDWVDYFPSFEIITGSQAHGRYFEDDARQVNQLGVAHAMRIFMREYIPTATPDIRPTERPNQSGIFSVMCDEDALDAAAI